ncbi:MAG TPA: hypothetical protein VJH04_04605 [archaeon]|nr:hypothetical protein [archaeon]
MKIYLAVAFLFLITAANAALVTWDADISINDDGGTEWAVVLTYNETVSSSDYFVPARATDIEVLADNATVNCDVTQDIGTSIVCKADAREFIYRFHVKNLVSTIGEIQYIRVFRYTFSATQFVERVHVIVKFPLGAALVEEGKLQGTGLRTFEPDFGREGSDGRRISISWTFDKPGLGQSISVSAIYELLGFDTFTIFFIVLAFVIVAFVLVVLFVFKKRGIRDILPVLTDGERKVMEIILRENGEVDQRVLVKETDFSKAKVSRVISDLMSRGLVEKVSKGRKNLIKLKKDVKRPETKTAK